MGKIHWRRERLPTPVFWPGEFHGLQFMGSQRVRHDLTTFVFTWETQPYCKKSFHKWPVKAVTSVPPGYPQRKLQGSLFSEGLIDVTWVEVGMGRKRYFRRCSSLWEGFYLNKLWNRTVIVHMDVSRLSVWYISWNVFLLAVFVKHSSDCLVSLLKSVKKLFQECTLAKKKKKKVR